MTRTDVLAELAALESHVATRVQIVRVVVDERGNEIGRIHRGWTTMPRDWTPPTFETLLAQARTKGSD